MQSLATQAPRVTGVMATEDHRTTSINNARQTLSKNARTVRPFNLQQSNTATSHHAPLWASANKHVTRTFVSGMDQRGVSGKQQRRPLDRHKQLASVIAPGEKRHTNKNNALSKGDWEIGRRVVQKSASHAAIFAERKGAPRHTKSSPGLVPLNIRKRHNSLYSNRMLQGSGATVAERRQTRLNAALCVSAEAGEVQVVHALMNDPRVDPGFNGCAVLRSAAKGGSVGVISLLLRDPRIDPSSSSNAAIRTACRFGHLNAVRRLLQDRRVDPSANAQYCVGAAAENGHYEIVELLLRHPMVDPSSDNNYAFHLATQNGHKLIAQMLMNDRRVSGSRMEDEQS
jgi:hypothetical protein